MNDRPIHLRPPTQPHTQPSVTCQVWLTQSNLDAMQALIQWLGGFEAAGKGQVPGHHELIMLYREIHTAIHRHYKEQDSVEIPE